MTAPVVLPTYSRFVEKVVGMVADELLSQASAKHALILSGLTWDETALSDALHHLGVMRGLYDHRIDPRSVVDALPTVPNAEVLAGAIAEHEAHYKDAVDVLAVRQAVAS